MRNAVGSLYLVTAILGMCWSAYLTLTGLYGVPFSWWYVAVFIGAVVLLIGAILTWTSASEWSRWVPLIGSGILAAYFVPAIIVVLRRYPEAVTKQPMDLLIRVVVVILVVASLVLAIRSASRMGSLIAR